MLESLFSEDSLLRLAMLCVVILAALSLPRCLLRRLNQTSEQFRKLNPFVKVIFGIFFFVFVVHGSFKQNSTNTQSSSLFAARHSPTIQSANLTEFVVRNWNIVGAWDDSFWCKFENDFVFPYGTNHLKGVEVLASGVLWKGPFNPEVISILGSPVELATGVSQFSCEYFAASETNEAKYVYSWYNGLVNRETNSVINGRIELRRSGDILVATNGVERYKAYKPPEGFCGVGQNEDWIRANFTNSEEIISVGYENWVADSVAVNTMNGRYSLAVRFDENFQSPCLLSVGRYNVYVRDPGVYHFLLDVYNEYSFSLFPSSTPVDFMWNDGFTGPGRSYEIESTELLNENDWRRFTFTMRPLVATSPDFLHLNDADGASVFAFWNVSGTTLTQWRDPLELVQFLPSDENVTTLSNVLQPTTLTVEMSNSSRTERGYVYIIGDGDSSLDEQPQRSDASLDFGDGLSKESLFYDGFDCDIHWFSCISSKIGFESEILRTNLTLQANTTYYVGAFAASSEYPVWTGRNSQYNDKLYWKAKISNVDFQKSATVNSLHSKFQIADSENNVLPGFGKVVHVGGKFFTIDSQNHELNLSLCAVNNGDAKRESGAIIGVFPIMVRQKNYPQTTGLSLTTDSGLTRTNALIRSDVPAYINSIPETPDLTSRIVSLPSWIEVEWSGSITSERMDRDIFDNRTLLPTNIAGVIAYDIKAAMTNEIVGGQCSIIAKLAGEEYEVAKFNIRGKNPLDAVAKAYIDSNVDEEFRDYAWMIAKHESRNPPSGQVYNQFNPSDGNYKELPFKGNGRYNWGWGIGQIDRGRNNNRTAEIYDWHENVKSMNKILRRKRARYNEIVGLYREAYQGDSAVEWVEPDSVTTNVNGVVMTARQWAIMTLYNGAGGTYPLPFEGRERERTPIHFDHTTSKWILYTNQNNYVPVVLDGANSVEVE